MPKKAGMEAWKKKRRKEYLEQKQFWYYIFCEGQQTEPQYFNGFKKLIECNPIYKDMVLIDEVDMHLHPKWQWNVVKTLKETFPNIQFIIATHSPIIISSCKAGNLILIDNKQEVCYLKDAYGYSVNDILELCQGSSDVSKNMKMLSEEFDMAISESDFDKAGQIVDTMTEE